ncbi:MAG: hypothetical protein RJB13_1004, partial [Pseudomonadota bacterium]
MNCRQRIGLLAVALSCSLDLAEAQNNLNNIEAVNGANSIDEINENSSNNTNNVLDSEELNSNESNLNSSGDISNENNFTNNNGSFSNNTLNDNNSSNNNSNFGNNENQENTDANNSDTNAGNSAQSNSNLNTQNSDLNGQEDASGESLSAKSSNASPNSAVNSSNVFEPENTGPSEPFAANPNDPLAPSNEFAPFPESGNDFSPSDASSGAVTEIPSEQLNTENSAQAQAQRKAQEREEKRKQKLDLARKMAENIPPLNPGEGPAEYTVQPGDTLWDISDQLLDDAMWWPRLWVLNPEIEDPDEIEPGMKVLFYPSISGEPPALVVRDDIDGFSSPKIDPTVLQTFSMKANRWIGKNGELVNAADLPGDQNLLTGGDMGAIASYTFNLPGFMSNSEIDTVGQVIYNSNMPLVAGKGQSIIALFKNGAPNPGERFVAIRHRPVFSSLTEVGGQSELYNYVGVLGVVKNTSSGHTVMVAEENMAYVSPTDLLIPFDKSLVVAIDPESTGRPNNAPGRVMATQDGTYTFAGPG